MARQISCAALVAQWSMQCCRRSRRDWAGASRLFHDRRSGRQAPNRTPESPDVPPLPRSRSAENTAKNRIDMREMKIEVEIVGKLGLAQMLAHVLVGF